jgi:hypothetical protein
MRPSDLARLNQPYPEDADPSDSAAVAALGMELPHWRVLETEILGDFTEQPPYGVSWWAPAPGTSRRILIADQLYCCVASVAGNMTEASLHWLEYLDASDRDSERFVDAVKMENGRARAYPDSLCRNHPCAGFGPGLSRRGCHWRGRSADEHTQGGLWQGPHRPG